jgi:hypothetical protein
MERAEEESGAGKAGTELIFAHVSWNTGVFSSS